MGPDFSQDRLLHCPTPGPTIAVRLPRNRGIGVAWIGKLDEVGIQNFKTTQCIIGVLGIAVTTVGVSCEDPIQTLTPLQLVDVVGKILTCQTSETQTS